MPDRYYHKVNRNEVLFPDLPDSDIVILPPEHLFWQALPDGHELTYDVDGIPDGTQLAPTDTLRTAVLTAGVDAQRVIAALYADHRGDPAPLAALDADVDQLVIDEGVTINDITGKL